jgi:hypothetical protein
MTQDEIIDMAIKAEFVSHGKPSEEDSELFVCTDKDILRFAKLVAERALADPMREVQRLGQEIEQEPVAWWNNTGTHIDLNVSGRGTPLYTTPPQRTEQEPVELPCCGYTDASAIKWNSFNGVVQCHNCGQTYTPPQRTEQNFCSRCGKRTKDIHTCTPPQENT